jgi:hypothetical protein
LLTCGRLPIGLPVGPLRVANRLQVPQPAPQNELLH